MLADPLRDEAERLIAAAIAAVSMAARGFSAVSGARGRSSGGFATGSPECCVCPLCRVIAAMRDPRADVAERLAMGAGDLAAAVASILRAFSRPSGGGVDDDATREGDEFWESLRRRARGEGAGPGPVPSDEDDPWRAATTGEPPRPAPAPKPMAKKAVAKKAVAKKAVAKKAVAKKASPAQSTPAPAMEAGANKAAKRAAKKTVTKAAKRAPAGEGE